jgi:hypothetical protein
MKNKYFILSILIGLFSILYKVTNIIKIPPNFDYYDSPSYFNFRVLGGVRMPLITLIYSNIDKYEIITLLQAFFSGIAWSILALTFYVLKIKPIVSFAGSLVIYSLGISTQIVFLESYLMAESFNISMMVLIIALSFIYAVRRKFGILFCLVFSLICFGNIKSVNGLLVWIPIMFLFGFYVFNNRNAKNFRKAQIITLSTSFIISLLTLFISINIDATPILNTSAIINSRLWNVEKWKEKTIEAGFPIESRRTFERYSSANLGLPPDKAVSLQEDYINWYENGGDNFLVKFLIFNPSYTLFGPILTPAVTLNNSFNQSIIYGHAAGIINYENKQTINAQLGLDNRLFWPNERALKYMFIGLCYLLLSFLINSKLTDPLISKTIIYLLTFGFALSYISWWFASTPNDIARHQFPTGVLIRVISIFAFIIVINNQKFSLTKFSSR